MRLRSLFVPAVALVLGVSLAPSAVADPPSAPGSKASQTGRDHRAEQAEAALAQVEAILAGNGNQRSAADRAHAPSLTLALRDLAVTKDALSGADRERADRFFARPGDLGDPYVPVPLPIARCSADICVHYTETGNHAPTGSDGDASTTPPYITQVLNTVQGIHDKYRAAGYRGPKSDGTVGGGNGLTDIYIGDLGDGGLYGFCNTDLPTSGNAPYDRAAYCALDDDYDPSEFPTNTPLENMRVTAAHEYFHAVQFAYDYFEDRWIMESTAAWVEDEMYDSVDDNRQYLRNSPLRKPWIPLDYGNPDVQYYYGVWIFWRYLTERFRTEVGGLPTLVRDVWRRLDGAAGGPDDYSTQGLRRVLASRHTNLTKQFALFSAANRHPRTAYSEGRAYPASPLARTIGIRAGRPNPAAIGGRLDHLTSATVRYVPKQLTSRRWKLRLAFNLQDTVRGSAAVVTVYKKRGGIATSLVRLNRRGSGAKTVPFSSRTVGAVDVTLVNASIRFRDCWTDQTWFSCFGGVPRDDNQLAIVDPRAVR